MTANYPFTECCRSSVPEIIAICRHLTGNRNLSVYNLGSAWSYTLECYGKHDSRNNITIKIK